MAIMHSHQPQVRICHPVGTSMHGFYFMSTLVEEIVDIESVIEAVLQRRVVEPLMEHMRLVVITDLTKYGVVLLVHYLHGIFY